MIRARHRACGAYVYSLSFMQVGWPFSVHFACSARVTPLHTLKTITITITMSCDFGPIPAPTSPVQEYWERKFKTPSSNVSPAIPLSPQVGRGIEEQLKKALNDLKKKQAASEKDADGSPGLEDSKTIDPVPQRKGSLASSTGYTAPSSTGLLKRRSLAGGSAASQPSSRRPSR